MNTLMCRRLKIALVLVWSGCAGSLDNAEDYQTPVPVRDAGPARMPEAGRAQARSGQTGGWGGARASAGQGAGSGSGAAGAGWKAPMASGNAGMGASQAGRSSDDNASEDAGVADAGPQMPSEPACDFRALMQAKCGNPSCHGAPASSTGLDLTSAMLGARVEARQGRGACSDKLLVDPDNPRESKLYLKVSGSTCGGQMPVGGELNAAEQACVLTWIEQL